MRKKINCLILLFILCLTAVSPLQIFAEESKGPEISSEAAILIDYKSGRVLFEKNADKKTYPASTTKIMTAILALENLELDSVLTASEKAIDIDRDGSNIGILAGEKFTVDQLLYALLVHSANDAANVLAEGVSGTIEDFVSLMNKKAGELGMKNTNYRNPHGYHDENHYMSARDLSVLSAYAMKNEKFAEIVSTPTYELPPTEKYPNTRLLSSNNMLINPTKGTKYIYKPAKGIKTGHTEDAGYCLASFAEQNNASYLCVTMNAETDEDDNYSFVDTIALFKYGFENYKMTTISNEGDVLATVPVKWAKGSKHAILTTKDAIEILLPTSFSEDALVTNMSFSEKIKAPVKKGDVLGSIEYSFEDNSLGVVDLVATEDIERSYMKMIFGTVFDIIFSAWVMIPLFTIAFLLLLIRTYNLRRRRKKKEMMRRQNRKNF